MLIRGLIDEGIPIHDFLDPIDNFKTLMNKQRRQDPLCKSKLKSENSNIRMIQKETLNLLYKKKRREGQKKRKSAFVEFLIFEYAFLRG